VPRFVRELILFGCCRVEYVLWQRENVTLMAR
jgi:hypothetical protein